MNKDNQRDSNIFWYPILGCDNHRKESKTCPVMLCNYEKQRQQNYDIFKRNFPENELSIRPDYREQYKVCGGKYKDMNIAGNPLHSDVGLTPGKADPFSYFANIDNESELYRLNIKNTKCESREFKPNFPQKSIIVNKSTLLDKPQEELNKVYQFNDSLPNYLKSCPTNNPKFEGIKFSSIDVKSKTCLSGFENTSQLESVRHPIPLQYKQEIENLAKTFKRDFLQVGPIRNNHTVERLWNNQTKSKVLPSVLPIPKGHNKVFCDANKKIYKNEYPKCE
jgi:hypothetical protein